MYLTDLYYPTYLNPELTKQLPGPSCQHMKRAPRRDTTVNMSSTFNAPSIATKGYILKLPH